MAVPDQIVGRPRGWRFRADMPASGRFCFPVAIAAMLPLYWSGFAFLLDKAWARPEYSYGYLIPPIAVYLLLRNLVEDVDRERPAVAHSDTLGFILVFLGAIAGLLGNFMQTPDITLYGFIVCVGGMALVIRGTRRGLDLWVPIFYLIFMIPLPSFIYYSLSFKLQLISSELGTMMIGWMGIPVFLDGNIIDLGVYQLQVAEACSGLRYLFPLMSFGFLFAALYKGPLLHKIVLFLLSVPITILMNSVRIGVIGFLVDRFGIGQAEGFLHFFEGWVIFISGIALLYLAAVGLQRLRRNPVSVQDMLAIDFAGLIAQVQRVRDIRLTGTLMLACAVLVVAALAGTVRPATGAVAPQRDPLPLFPLELGDWRGHAALLDAKIEGVLRADDYLDVDYTLSEGVLPVNFFVAYYKVQVQGDAAHSPEVCIPGGGWEVSAWTKVDSGVRATSGQPLAVNRAIIRKGLLSQLVYYWYDERGRNLTSTYSSRLYMMIDALSRGRSDGALVRVVTPIPPNTPVSEADDRLRGFLKLAVTKLDSYIPP